jgi:hypothetical protein
LKIEPTFIEITIMINIERECVEQALIIKSNSAQRRLTDLRKNGRRLENLFSGLTSGVEWEKDIKKRMIQAVLIPLVLLVVICLAVLIFPITYLVNIRAIYNEKRDLKKELKLCDINFASTLKNTGTNKPNIKTIESLWAVHGLDNTKFTMDEHIEVLSKWITILYGEDTAMNINIDKKLATMTANRIELNRPYYENPSSGTHYHFAPIFPSVLAVISNELSVYAPEDEVA